MQTRIEMTSQYILVQIIVENPLLCPPLFVHPNIYLVRNIYCLSFSVLPLHSSQVRKLIHPEIKDTTSYFLKEDHSQYTNSTLVKVRFRKEKNKLVQFSKRIVVQFLLWTVSLILYVKIQLQEKYPTSIIKPGTLVGRNFPA